MWEKVRLRIFGMWFWLKIVAFYFWQTVVCVCVYIYRLWIVYVKLLDLNRTLTYFQVWSYVLLYGVLFTFDHLSAMQKTDRASSKNIQALTFTESSKSIWYWISEMLFHFASTHFLFLIHIHKIPVRVLLFFMYIKIFLSICK